jgi:hypothetical protein
MRSTSVALAVAIVSTWTGAHCAEMPDGSNETAALRTDFSIAHPNPHSRSKIVVSDPGAGLAFIAEGAIPMPLLKPPPAWRQPPTETICRLIRSAAREHEIPAGFLTRLIWQESRFRVTAVSHAGAQGIAQFMPATAAERDLEDPFDPRQAVRAAASLLSSLNERFGNLGLAAAAYNAGPGRVSAWLRKRKRLPAETRNYVKAITGRPASSWAKAKKKDLGIVGKAEAETVCASSVVAMAGGG